MSDDADRREAQENRGLQMSADSLTAQVEGLRSELVVQQSVNRRMKRVAWTAVGLVALCFLLIAGGGFLYANQRDFIHCLQDWADKTTSRSNAVLPASTDRAQALDKLIRTQQLPPGDRAAAGRAAYFAYLRTSDHYLAVSANHPVPKSPKLAC